MCEPNVVVVIKEQDANSTHSISLDGVAPCSHEEADTRIFVHARHAVEEGNKAIMVKASDTTCEACRLPGRLHLESVSSTPTRNIESGLPFTAL